MCMTIIFGNINLRFPDEKYLERSNKVENPFEFMMSKNNLSSFNNFYKKAFSEYINSYKLITKSLLEYAKNE